MPKEYKASYLTAVRIPAYTYEFLLSLKERHGSISAAINYCIYQQLKREGFRGNQKT